MKLSINPTEHQIQCAIVEWANKITIPDWENTKIGDFLFAIPNGGNRSITEAIRLKKEGVKKGVSDLFFPFPLFSSCCDNEKKIGLWIEVKSQNGKPSNYQKNWISLMKSVGYDAVIVNTVDEGIKAIENYLGMR
ncbi:MAG: VRR-NUC domain-containing protein [Candidatus Nitrosocosmicus sp.]